MNIFNKKILTATLVVFGLLGLASTVSAAGPAIVNLGSAGNFVILSKTAITTTGATAITGDLGISPAFSTSMTGFALVLDGSGTFSTSALVTGRIYAANHSGSTPAIMTAAISDMEAAYTDALSRSTDVLNTGAGNLAGLNLVPSTYTFNGAGDVIITSDVTLTGGANDVWVFQIPGNLNISSSMKVLLAGGAQASNIFWAVAGTTTLQPGSTFEGNILAGPGASTIAMQSGAILNGRALGQTDVTMIGNTVRVPVLAAAVVTSNSNSGRRNNPPIIGVLIVPSPLSVTSASSTVNYRYTAWNVGGQDTIANITVVDDKCSPLVRISGDNNGDNTLDPGERWRYTCTKTLKQTTTNTVVATGYSNDLYHRQTVATAVATVVMNSPAVPPLINIVKVPNRLTPFSFGGGNIMYLYTVTNPGVTAISNVVVADNKCSPISGPFGDINADGKLDLDESWTYACQTYVPTTMNTVATAKGEANGYDAIGYAYATVLVGTPGLPNAGFESEESSLPWGQMMIAGVVALLIVSLGIVFKRRSVIVGSK